MRKTKKYFLQHESMGYLGNSPYFWRKGGSGYTADVDDAQQFTAAEAAEIIRSNRGTHHFKRWPVESVLAIAIRVVDMQDLRAQE